VTEDGLLIDRVSGNEEGVIGMLGGIEEQEKYLHLEGVG